MPELLNWIHSWLQNQYLNNSSKTDDISLCIRAVQYIQEHVTESVRVEAAADAVGMSRGYFSTKFREVTGETFHNCVIRYKMKTAAQEIRKGEKSMTEIALELGYDNFLLLFPSCSEKSTDVHRESFKKEDEKNECMRKSL